MNKTDLFNSDTGKLKRRKGTVIVVAAALVLISAIAVVGYIAHSKTVSGSVGQISNTGLAEAADDADTEPSTAAAQPSTETPKPDTTVKIVDLKLDKANNKLNECITKANGLTDAPDNNVQALANQCFYSISNGALRFMDIATIPDVKAVDTSFIKDSDGSDAKSRKTYKTVTGFNVGDKLVATLTCYWDPVTTQCKAIKSSFTDLGSVLRVTHYSG